MDIRWVENFDLKKLTVAAPWNVAMEAVDRAVRVASSDDNIGCVFFRWPGPARGRFRDVIDGPGPTGLARGKRTVTVIAYRLFHLPAKDLRYEPVA